MALALILAAKLLFVLGLAVRFAGADHILNIVCYDRVSEPAALHAWVGNRLLVFALLTTGLALIAFRSQAIALFCLLAFVIAVFVFAGWLMVGAGRFTAGGLPVSSRPKAANRSGPGGQV